MQLAQATLTIANVTYKIGDSAETPDGAGVIIGLDPFSDTEIAIRFEGGAIRWYSWVDVRTAAV